MINKLVALNEKEINIVSGGNIAADAGKAILNTGTALAFIDLIHKTQDYFCPEDTKWVKTCKLTKEVSDILASSMYSLVPLIGKYLTPTTQDTPAVSEVLKAGKAE